MERKRRRSLDVEDLEKDENRKRPKLYTSNGDHIVWPPSSFDLTYLAWARRQFSKTGFCIDFRARWMKSRYGCPLCDRYNVRKAGDIDRLCENANERTQVVANFPTHLNSEVLESIEYLMCSRPHGAQSFKYEIKEEGDAGDVQVAFNRIHHLGWPELSNLLDKDLLMDLTVDLNEQRLVIQFKPNSITPLAVDEVALSLVGYYLRSDCIHFENKENVTV